MNETLAHQPPVRMCATCASRETHTPMRCGLLRDMNGRPSLCADERGEEGRCGRDGAYWRQATPGECSIIQFPGEMRWPRAGGFDGSGSAA